MSEQTVVLATYTSMIEATIVKAALDAEGIAATLVGTEGSAVWGGTIGLTDVKVLVHVKDVERARAVVATAEAKRGKGAEATGEDNV